MIHIRKIFINLNDPLVYKNDVLLKKYILFTCIILGIATILFSVTLHLSATIISTFTLLFNCYFMVSLNRQENTRIIKNVYFITIILLIFILSSMHGRDVFGSTLLVPVFSSAFVLFDYNNRSSRLSFLFIVVLIGIALAVLEITDYSLFSVPLSSFHKKLYFLMNITLAITGISFSMLLVQRILQISRERLQDERQNAKETAHRALVERKKAIELEKNIALKNERESVFKDIHDHLGARVTDLIALLSNLKGRHHGGSAEIFRINEITERIRHDLTHQMQDVFEAERIMRNFLPALSSILHTRYSNSGRLVHIKAEDRAKQLIEKIKPDIILHSLYPIITEIISNDLKYGVGNSFWYFESIDEVILSIRFISKSIYDKETPGFGTSNMQSRAHEIKAFVETTFQGSVITIQIQIPVL